MSKKVVWFLIDGLGDVGVFPDPTDPCAKRTPLQVAHTPNMDKIARSGWAGYVDPVDPGLACGSDTAHLSLFGYPPRTYYRGRGAFESLGAGLEMQPGDIAFKSNFAVWDRDTRIVTSRRADRSFEREGPILCDALNDIPIPGFPEHRVFVKYATEHRCGVIVRGPRLTDGISGTDPLKDGLPLVACAPTETSHSDGTLDDATFTCTVVEAVSQAFMRVLEAHPLNKERQREGKPPANLVLLRGCGVMLAVQPFAERHKLRPVVIAPTAIIAGLAMSLGIERIVVPGTTGDYHSDLNIKGIRAAEVLAEDRHDFCFVHIKCVDDAGHDKNPDLKVEMLAKVDVAIGHCVRRLAELGIADRVALCVTGDHSTPVLTGDHSHECVPFAISRAQHLLATDTPRDNDTTKVREFSETGMTRGVLGRFNGAQVMPIITRFMREFPE